ncbi:unnamed protein product [Tuber aestivum]|uniref:Uncharacterized protein n=1 Tax=Tuber aestivum TaxID=59557 RepID=A0A292PU60_9PEZI|nr:unnamed protein product [Tuber aestivum]
MATKIFNLRQCHKSMAWTPKLKYRPFQPPYMHRRSNFTNTEYEPEDESTCTGDHPPKTKLWEFVLRNDGRLGSLEKQVKDVEIERYQATNQIDSRMSKGFSDVGSNVSEVKRTTDRLEAKLGFIQWQLGLVGTAILGFFGVSDYLCAHILGRVWSSRVFQTLIITKPDLQAATEIIASCYNWEFSHS